MTNRDIAQLLRNIAASYELLGESRFRINAYRQAADSIENLSRDLKSIWEDGNIQKVAGIGKSLAEHFDEMFTKGESSHFNEVEQEMPSGMFDYLKLRGVGPKTAYRLSKEIENRNIEGNTSMVRLEKFLDSHALVGIDGFSDKREKELFQAVKQFKKGATKKQRLFLPEAEAIAHKLCTYINEHKLVIDVQVLGSLRRRKDTIGDIDIAVSTDAVTEVADYILKYSDIRKIDNKGKTRVSFLVDGKVQVDIRLIYPSQFGSMIQYFTGSKYHNIRLREYALARGLSLSEWGIKRVDSDEIKSFDKEDRFYQYLGLQYIPPEMREDNGEIELAKNNKLPKLVELKDIKGDLHIHGDFDYPSSHDTGTSTLKDILLSGEDKRYEYIGISDHNPKYKGLTEDEILTIMKSRRSYYEHDTYYKKCVQKKEYINKVYNMLEIDIRPNGELALIDNGFETIDAAIVSIHSSFTQDRDKMTKRILKGLSHPKVKIFGHPTGRLLGKRDGINADWSVIFKYCKKHTIALEINSSTQRLDLPDSLVREARIIGSKFIISTDSHNVNQLDQMRYGISVARRGWLTKDDILNTLSLKEFDRWLMSDK